MKNFIDENFATIIKAILVIFIIVMVFIYYINKSSDDYVEITPQDKIQQEIEKLKEENDFLKENLSHKEAQLEDLEREHEHDEELIDILQKQLLSYGIEPDEL